VEPAATNPGLRLALALDESLAAVLALLDARVAGAVADLRPGLLPDRDAAGAESSPGAEPSGRASSPGLQILLADPWDVPPLVVRGVADAGVAPKHVLAELQAELAEVLDLAVGEQVLVYAEAAGRPPARAGRRLRVATAHPHITRTYFARAGTQVDTFALRAAAELATVLGAVDGAMITLPRGEARTPAGLEVRAEVLRSSARLVVSRSARVVRAAEVAALVERLRATIRTPTPEET